jgi:hypothetical protein
MFCHMYKELVFRLAGVNPHPNLFPPPPPLKMTVCHSYRWILRRDWLVVLCPSVCIPLITIELTVRLQILYKGFAISCFRLSFVKISVVAVAKLHASRSQKTRTTLLDEQRSQCVRLAPGFCGPQSNVLSLMTLHRYTNFILVTRNPPFPSLFPVISY